MSPSNREPDVLYSWYKHQWATGMRQEAFSGVQLLAQELGNAQLVTVAGGPLPDPERLLLCAKVHLKLGMWRRHMVEELTEGSINSIMSSVKSSTEYAPGWGKAWHQWAYFNCEVSSRNCRLWFA
jgi:FKBP12-rapamycin complex-associated protein